MDRLRPVPVVYDYAIDAQHVSEYGKADVPLTYPTLQADDNNRVHVLTFDPFDAGLRVEEYEIEVL